MGKKGKLPKMLHVQQRDGSVWGVPVDEVAQDRAENYKGEFGDSIERSLKEDTIPLFEEDHWEITEWASNNMNWSDFKAPVKISDAEPLAPKDFQMAWMDAEKTLV